MKKRDLLNTDQYWATIEDHSILLDHLDTKIKDYYDDLRATGLLTVWERSYRSYYGGRVSSGSGSLFDSSRLAQGGKQGQKTRLKANHYRNLIRHLHQLVTQQKPNVQARASNSDYKSQAQTILGNGLIDYYWREKNVGSYVRDAVELDLLYGEAFIHAPWDPNRGEIIAVGADGMPMYEGDQAYAVLSPLDVIRDPSLKDYKSSEFVIIKSVENRWNLSAKNKGLEQEILASSSYDENQETSEVNFQIRASETPINTDMVTMYTMYHKKSEALPQGRMLVFLKDLVLFDGPLPYHAIPVFRMAAEQLFDTIYGYTVAFDLLGVQEGIDELHTALMSNNKTFGIQSLWIKDTDKLQTSTAGEGMRVFKSEEPPTPIQLVKSAPESYSYLDKLEATGEMLSGISSTVRGAPDANLKSGNALALVVSQSIQFISSVEEAMNRLVEEIGTGLINNLRDFSKTKRVANIIGESQRPFAKEFTSDDLDQINRVVVDQVNPLSKTVAGRSEIANNLLQQGMIRDAEQYLMVLSTGQLEPVTEGPQAEMLTIRAENEEMREGRPVIAVMTENHALHIREHKNVIGSPEAKKNPELIMAVLAHIQEHIDLARNMDPALAMILGQQPLPPAAVQPSAVNGPAQAPQEVQAEQVKMPNMPNLPPNAPEESQAAYEKLPQVS